MEISFWFGKGDIPNEKIRLPPLEVHFEVGGCGRLFGGTVPPCYVLFGGTIPPHYVLFGGTVPPNSFFFFCC